MGALRLLSIGILIIRMYNKLYKLQKLVGMNNRIIFQEMADDKWPTVILYSVLYSNYTSYGLIDVHYIYCHLKLSI